MLVGRAVLGLTVLFVGLFRFTGATIVGILGTVADRNVVGANTDGKFE